MYSTQQVGKAINTYVSEYFTGFVVVGFLADTNEPVIISSQNEDPKTVLALNALIQSAVQRLIPRTVGPDE